MDATAEFSVNFAFVLEPVQIKKVYKLLKDRIAKPNINAKCSDDMVREFVDVKNLLEYENSCDRRILSLTFWSKTEDWKKQARISFTEHSWGTINFTVEGAENTVIRLKEELGDIVDGTKAWYWRISRIDFFYVILVIAFIGYTVLKVYTDTLEKSSSKEEFDLLKTLGAIGILTGVIALFPASIWTLNLLRRRFFPAAVFAIGQESKRFQIDDKIRWTLIGGFLVSFAASIVVAAILSV